MSRQEDLQAFADALEEYAVAIRTWGLNPTPVTYQLQTDAMNRLFDLHEAALDRAGSAEGER